MQYPFSPLDGYGPKRVSGLSDRQRKIVGPRVNREKVSV
jgi:hypothetical protein